MGTHPIFESDFDCLTESRMAGNFWQSSHCKQWLLEPHEIYDAPSKEDRQKVGGEENYRKLMILFANFIQAIGEQLKIRQQVIATATVFFRRFYLKNTLSSCDPLLMSPTCLFLAAKVEEIGPMSNNRLVNATSQVVRNRYRSVFNDLPGNEYPYRTNNILECEFYLLELMDCCLIVFHPYRPLLQFLSDLNITSPDDPLSMLSWRIINDSYRSDVMLQYPPYMIALSALHVASVNIERDLTSWFAELSVDLVKIHQISKELLKLYEVWESFRTDQTQNNSVELGQIFKKIPKSKPVERGGHTNPTSSTTNGIN